MMDYLDYFERLRVEHPDLAADLADARGLEGVMSWMRRKGLHLADIEIIHQDEYSLDFIIPLQAGGSYLVFGIT